MLAVTRRLSVSKERLFVGPVSESKFELACGRMDQLFHQACRIWRQTCEVRSAASVQDMN
jgi:hypothetical protein